MYSHWKYPPILWAKAKRNPQLPSKATEVENWGVPKFVLISCNFCLDFNRWCEMVFFLKKKGDTAPTTIPPAGWHRGMAFSTPLKGFSFCGARARIHRLWCQGPKKYHFQGKVGCVGWGRDPRLTPAGLVLGPAGGGFAAGKRVPQPPTEQNCYLIAQGNLPPHGK